MTINDKRGISEKRSYRVVKHNDLIQKTAFEIPAIEQKLLAYSISRIKPEDKELLKQRVSIAEICKVCGIEKSGGNYRLIKNAFKQLRDRSWWYALEEGKETLVFFYSDVQTNKNTGYIELTFGERMMPYLIELKDNFTAYELNNVLKMKSQYGIRLYELLKSHQFKRKIEYKIDDLKKILSVDHIESYNKFSLFKGKVIETAIKEINDLTDLKISYTLKKVGRSYYYITFKINERNWIETIQAKDKAFGDEIEGQIRIDL
jgi:plasmid replication initiation protein